MPRAHQVPHIPHPPSSRPGSPVTALDGSAPSLSLPVHPAGFTVPVSIYPCQGSVISLPATAKRHTLGSRPFRGLPRPLRSSGSRNCPPRPSCLPDAPAQVAEGRAGQVGGGRGVGAGAEWRQAARAGRGALALAVERGGWRPRPAAPLPPPAHSSGREGRGQSDWRPAVRTPTARTTTTPARAPPPLPGARAARAASRAALAR